MSDDQHPHWRPSGEGDAIEPPELTAFGGGRQVVPREEQRRQPRAGLPVVVIDAVRAENHDWGGASPAGAFVRRWAAVAALGFAVLALGGATFLIVKDRQQASLLADRARENAELQQTVSALNTRLQAVETTKGRDALAEMRRSVADIKTAAVNSRELSNAIAQLSQRVEKLDREQGMKLDRLGERVDHETNVRTAELTSRLDKLEKKPAPAPLPVPPAPAQPLRAGAGVSMEPTGSIERSRQVLRGYVVLGAQNDMALIGGRYGERAVRAGDFLPGAGRVQRVERQGANWVVVTDQGLIASAYAAPN